MTVKVGITCGGDLWEPERIRFVEDSGFDAYGTTATTAPDPVAQFMQAMAGDINALKARIETLERGGADVTT